MRVFLAGDSFAGDLAAEDFLDPGGEGVLEALVEASFLSPYRGGDSRISPSSREDCELRDLTMCFDECWSPLE